jgi:hypothetical protein
MAGVIDIANVALEILGKPAITSLLDNSNAARAINSTYDITRRALIAGRSTWRFSVKRASLAPSAVPVVSGPYATQYPLPSDCLRVLLAGDTYPGLDLSDYRMGPTDAGYVVEGRMILCDYGSPLSLQYVADITDTTMFDPWFVMYLAAELAWVNCERLTGSDAKQEAAKQRKEDARSNAVASDALVNTPQFPADDTWILSRMQ